jgi:prepilin-type N-terminal cleavage/methylation domain-containing protein
MIIKAFKIIMTVFIKSLLISLYQREEFPSLVKRGKGRFSNQCQFNFETLNKKEAGFSLVELMITMVVFVLFMAAASQVFTGLLTQFKQQSKMAETNIEGIVGLEILRQDIESAGYGLPWHVEIDGDGDGNDWEQLTNYNETSTNPYSLNDATTAAPRAILSKNSATFTGSNNIFDGSDYLVIKAVNVGRNDACDKWTTLSSSSPYVRTWTPASENLASTDRVIVLRPGSSDADARTLVVNGSVFSTTLSGVSSTPWRSTDPSETRLVYGVDPDTDLGMPFNRADYFISNANVPQRCAPNTGVLEKATVNQNGGGFTYLPLLDCVADMQVIYGLDLDNDGDFEPGVAGSTDGYNEDLTPFTAQTIRQQVKEVRVYILSHEGQRDMNYTYCPSSAASCSTAFPVGEFGLGSPFDLTTKIGDPDYKYYRWKLYTIVVTPHNLE